MLVVHRPARRTLLIAVALALALAMPTSASAHGLFRDGDPADLVQDMLLNFALPLVVLVIGALVGVALSKWLARPEPGDDSEQDDAADAVAPTDSAAAQRAGVGMEDDACPRRLT